MGGRHECGGPPARPADPVRRGAQRQRDGPERDPRTGARQGMSACERIRAPATTASPPASTTPYQGTHTQQSRAYHSACTARHPTNVGAMLTYMNPWNIYNIRSRFILKKCEVHPPGPTTHQGHKQPPCMLTSLARSRRYASIRYGRLYGLHKRDTGSASRLANPRLSASLPSCACASIEPHARGWPTPPRSLRRATWPAFMPTLCASSASPARSMVSRNSRSS